MNPRQQRWLIGSLKAFLVVAIGIQLAWWGWHFIAAGKAANAANTSTGADFTALGDYKLIARQLFGGDGTASIGSSDTGTAASDISLKGVFAVDGKTLSAAVVNLGGKDRVAWLNEELTNGVKLTEVHADYILVSRAGGNTITNEKIMLEPYRGGAKVGVNNSAAGATAGFRLNVAAAGSNSYSLSRQELNNVLQDPRQLEFLGRIGNAANGGISVDDAPANSLSNKLGLRVGDTITAINGQPITGTGDLARFYQQFATISQVRIEIKRGGAPMLLTYAVQN